jgi:chemotaxis protein CheD
MTCGYPLDPPHVHLAPGRLLVTREEQVVATVLGSCVAVTMFHEPTGLAAICHAMLAAPRAGEAVSTGDRNRFRYMSHALPEMIGSFHRAGVRPQTVEVKLFGGANVIGNMHQAHPLCIGGSNVAAARRLLERASFEIAAENTGGDHGRKILFNTATGEVLLKHLARGHA